MQSILTVYGDYILTHSRRLNPSDITIGQPKYDLSR